MTQQTGRSPNRRRRVRYTSTALAAAVALAGCLTAAPAVAEASSASRPGTGASADATAPTGASTRVSVARDRSTGAVTLTDGDLRMVLQTKGGARVSSFTAGSRQELLAAGLTSSLQLDVDGSTLDSRTTASDPTVTTSNTGATVAFTMANDQVSVDERWTFRLDRSGIHLQSSRSYDWAETTNTAIRHNGQLEVGWARVWDDIRRPEDGGNLPIGNPYTGANGFFLSEPKDRYGLEEGTFVMLSDARDQAVSVAADPGDGRSVATEFSYTGDGNTYQEGQVSTSSDWQYTAGDDASGLSYGGHSSNLTDAVIYSPVRVAQHQRDTVDYTFALSDHDAWTSLGGTVKGVDDTAALSSLINQFGRSGVVDKGLGMSTVGLRYPGVGPYDMVYADRTVLGMYDPALTRSQQSLLTWFKENAQQDTGHMKGRAFHRDQTWTANQLFDADPSYALAVSDMYQYGGDREWLDSMRSSVESALAYMTTSQYVEADGLFRNDTVSCTKLAGLREWNDAYYVKYESGYINELMYGALTQWAGIERDVYGDAAQADEYERIAAGIKTRFNKDIADGGLWDPATGMFAYWRCPDGTVQGAKQHTQVNLQAIIYGLVDLPRAKQILDGVNTAVAKNHLSLIPQNFLPMTANVEDWTGDHFQTGLEDGAVYPFMTEEYMRAAALVGERSRSLTYLDNTLARYTEDGFNGFSFVDWQGNPHTGEAWFPSNANGGTGLFSDVLGIQPSADGVTIAPNIPTSMNGTNVTRTIHAADSLTVAYQSELTQRVTYRPASAQRVTLQWSGQRPGGTYTVVDGGSRHTVTADDMGVARYTYQVAAKRTDVRTVTLRGGSAAGHVWKDTVPTDLALGKAVSYSSSLEDGSFGAATVTDGDLFSADKTWGWSSSDDTAENHTEWLSVDLGKPQRVGSVELDQRDYDLKDPGTAFPVDFTIETSVDGKHWTNAVTQAGYAQPKTSAGQVFSFDARTARYVRVTGTNLRPEGSLYRMQFAEVQVFGTR